MALLINVVYPSGERAIATGYVGGTLVVQIIPRGPEAALDDAIEVDYTGTEPYRVVRVIGGPRRPTIRLALAATAAERELWMDAREHEGWDVRLGDGDDELYAVATRDDADVAALVRAGATLR